MGAGWTKYGAPDDREVNTLKGKLNEVQNKLLSIKNVENPVNNDERNNKIAKIEEGMKNMLVNGNNAIIDLYSKFDSIGDFSNKTKFRNPVKEQEKKQSTYLENFTNISEPQKKTRGRPKKYLKEEDKRKKKSEENRIYREKQKEKENAEKKSSKSLIDESLNDFDYLFNE